MNDRSQGVWWEPHLPSYDAQRTERLRNALMALIERDVDFSLDAMVQGCHYPGAVRLEVLVVEQDEEVGEESADDWFFTLAGPAFRIVLIAVGEPESKVLRHPRLDEVENEAAALAWLGAPPAPESVGHR